MRPSTIEDTVDQRRCSSCGEWFLRTHGNFVRNKSCRLGLTATCKRCSANYSRKWKRENAERLKPRRRELYKKKERVVEARRVRRRWVVSPLTLRAQVIRSGMVARSRKNRLDFDSESFTTAKLVEWFKRQPNCECCGVELDFGKKISKGPSNNSPSMDRIIPGDGYIVNNTALICWRCNNLKRDARPDELETIAAWMRHRSPDSWGLEAT